MPTGSINLTGKIDVRTGKTTNLTIGGSMVMSGGHYPSGRSQYYFNTDKNYLSKSGTYRGYVRFTQRFQSDPNSTSLVSNVYYSIQADYSRYKGESGDPELWNNIFAYGNLGKFTTYRAPNYQLPIGRRRLRFWSMANTETSATSSCWITTTTLW